MSGVCLVLVVPSVPVNVGWALRDGASVVVVRPTDDDGADVDALFGEDPQDVNVTPRATAEEATNHARTAQT